MTRDEVLATLKSAEPALRARGVTRAAVFGSVARGEADPHSDIDIMVDIDPEAHVGVFGLVEIMDAIGDLFPTKVDVSKRDQPSFGRAPNAMRSMLSDRTRDALDGMS